ncbi:histidinol dehydrogenase [Pelagicoccus sp. SDUM812003]|uniref:histidinol dehydrogenase n=1 Tax=Pelagicoccus sp. SDUM812003 TaxID=3041267 RepID=UPI00280CA06E|nr:histidinol dehydrogenase [Pelagicoccus sp. SDUM812003]MDQ8204826.1 histidinol dehydrogenase [Pelagicoccus sp. SDUM812003]
MADLAYKSRTFWGKLEAFCETSSVPKSIVDAVSSVLDDVRVKGDAGVAEALGRIDGVSLKSEQFPISRAEMKAAVKRLPKSDVDAIKHSVASVTEFHRHALPKSWTAKNAHGATIGERFYPLGRVGLYIPRDLVSTVVMTASLAKLAGVKEIVAFTPCNSEGKVNDGCLAAMYLSGVTEAYRFGGIMAVGAMAYGTETIKPALKVYGPGNAFVVEAKRQVYGTIGVDLLPGPSELLVIADDHADPEFVAADLLAQAEHGSGREKIFLVSLSKDKTKAIRAAMREQMKTLSRKDAIKAVLKDGLMSVIVDTYEDAAKVANYVAPEHMELEVDPKQFSKLIKSITTAGAIMQGGWSATALGDFVAGPSHELPTGRSGQCYSGLQISDFMRRSSLVKYSKAALGKAASAVEAFARMEGLDAHGRSVSVRLERRS